MKRIRFALLAALTVASAAFAADKLIPSRDDTGAIRRFVDLADGTWAELHAVVGSVASGATDSGNPVKIGARYNVTPPTLTDGQRGDVQAGSRGSLNVTLFGQDNTAAASVNTAAGGDAQSNTTNVLQTRSYLELFNGTTWDRVSKATTTSRIVSAAASTNATSAKASAGTIHCIEAFNASAATKFLKIYNKASAPTVGTDTPVRTLALKTADRTAICFPQGLFLSTGIAYALTGAAADNDATALTAADVVGLNIDYN